MLGLSIVQILPPKLVHACMHARVCNAHVIRSPGSPFGNDEPSELSHTSRYMFASNETLLDGLRGLQRMLGFSIVQILPPKLVHACKGLLCARYPFFLLAVWK